MRLIVVCWYYFLLMHFLLQCFNVIVCWSSTVKSQENLKDLRLSVPVVKKI